jgi:hypothetical protein
MLLCRKEVVCSHKNSRHKKRCILRIRKKSGVFLEIFFKGSVTLEVSLEFNSWSDEFVEVNILILLKRTVDQNIQL